MRAKAYRGLPFLIPGLLWVAAFFIVPLSVIAVYSVWQRTGGRLVTEVTLANYARFFGRDYFVDALVNSLEVTSLTTVISILLAYPLAYILAYRVPARWQRLALVLAILPFWTSYVVRSRCAPWRAKRGRVVRGR